MIEELERAQASVSGLRENLLKERCLFSIDGEGAILSHEAKKKVLWYLDLLAARLAGAHRHINNFAQDDIFSDVEKDDMQTKVVDRLRKDLETLLPPIIKNYVYSLYTCITEGLDEKREVVKQIILLLESLDQKVDFICRKLTPD